MTITVRISRCIPGDLGRLERLIKHAWVAAYAPIMGEDRAMTSAARFTKPYLLWLIFSGLLGSCRTLKAMAGDRIAGMAYAVPDDDEIILYMLYTHPEFQGQGVGSSLLGAIEAWQPSAKAIRLETLKGNAGAISWYQRRGFEIYGATENATGTAGIPAVYMERRRRAAEG